MEPVEYDIVIKRGEDFSQALILADVDLDGASAASHVRKFAGAPELIQEVTCTVDAESGRVTMSLTREQTAAIPAGKYRYDLYLIIGGAKKYPVEGMFEVRESVTV